MKLRDLLRERYKILLGFECCHEFQKELDTDEDDEFLDRIERVIGKWLDREVPDFEGVKPVKKEEFNITKCGKCSGQVISTGQNFCMWCGTKIDWRNEDGTS